MKKRIYIYIVIGIVLSVITFLLINTFAHRNENLEITMKSNAGVHYEWIYEIENKSIIKFVKNYVVDKNDSLEGGYISTNYVFKGLKKGESKVIFKYVDISDHSNIAKTEELLLKVDSHKNVSLVLIEN